VSIVDALATALAAAEPVTDDTPPGAVVHQGYAGGDDVFWSSCRRCGWWAGDEGDPDASGFVTEAQATADAARHNSTVTIHARKGHRTP